MAKLEPQNLSVEPEEPYHSSSDEDFNPSALPAADDSSSSTSEDETPPAITKLSQRKRKRKAPSPTDFDSGDEATIQAARRRRNKKRKGDNDGDDEDIILSDDEGGEGGLVKTRAQRRIEQKERRPLAKTDGATVDVDALWAQMSSAPLRPKEAIPPSNAVDTRGGKKDAAKSGTDAPSTTNLDEEDLITIKRTYTFAGQRVTEEKRVPKSSAEARLYLAELAATQGTSAQAAESTAQPDSETQVEEPNSETPQNAAKKLRRPLRRPSRFDPNPTGFVRGLPPELQLKWPRKAITISITQPDQENGLAASTASPAPSAAVPTNMPPPEKAQRLNVVEKSRYDWVGYVDKEGIADELDEHGRAKEAYLGRMEFLAGVEARKEEERRRAKGVTSAGKDVR